MRPFILQDQIEDHCGQGVTTLASGVYYAAIDEIVDERREWCSSAGCGKQLVENWGTFDETK